MDINTRRLLVDTIGRRSDIAYDSLIVATGATQSSSCSIRARAGAASAIIANNAMANIDDLDEIFRGVKALLAPDGAFVFETQYALDVFEKSLLDVIYHEHISTFSVQPVVRAVPHARADG